MPIDPPKERIFEELGRNSQGTAGIRVIPRDQASKFQKCIAKLLGTAVVYNDKEYILNFASLQNFRRVHQEHKALFTRSFVKNLMNFSNTTKQFAHQLLSRDIMTKKYFEDCLLRIGVDKEIVAQMSYGWKDGRS